MAFLIYKLSCDQQKIDYKNPKPLKVNQLASILIDYLRGENSGNSGIFAWHISEDQVLTNLGFDPRSHAFVIDVKPEVNRNVSLCRLREIWGYSNQWWTPVLLRLQSIFIDKENDNPKDFKLIFDNLQAENEVLHEFLYLDAGTTHGRRRWGKTGYVNAALLWPDALRHFISIVEGEALDDSHC